MSDPVVSITNGVPTSGTGTITTLGLTIPPAATTTTTVQGGPMCQGAVVTSAPTYTNATINALTLDTGGRLNTVARVLGNAGGILDAASTQNVATPANMILTGGEFNTTPTTITSGNCSPLQLDAQANTRVVQPFSSLTTAAWNSSTTLGTWQAFIFGQVLYSSIVGSMVTTTTITGGALTFEESYDAGTTYKAIPTSRLIDPITNTLLANPYTLTANANQQFQILTIGCAFIRVRLSTVIAGTGTLTLFWVVGSLPGDEQVFQSNPANLQSAMSGDTANAATDAGYPVKIGGLAKTTNPTAVSDGQRVNATFDKQGKQVVVGAIRQLKGVQNTSITASTETTVLTAGAAGVFQDLYGLTLTNSSATVALVTIKDATAGTTRFVFEVPANDTRGFMLPVDSAVPQATAANNWTATVSPATTTLYVTCLYVSNT
jgi:hypothetical protein